MPSPNAILKHRVREQFAGSAADGITLLEKFEKKYNEFKDVTRAAVELAKDWRQDRALRRLEALLAESGVQVFARIDHAAGAEKVGFPLRPTQVLLFGNPAAGTPLMQSSQTIDLPLKALAW